MSIKTATLLLLFAVFVILLIIRHKQQAQKKEKIRREKLKRDYPELVSKLLLLIQAGLVTRSAFFRIASDYKKEKLLTKEVRPAFEEIIILCQEMEKGVGESECYKRLGQRCLLPNYRTLSVLLDQNMKKGGTALKEMLEREMITASEERKRLARTDGERAAIKLLLPMGLMLVVVLAIIIIPAFMSF